MISLSAQSAQTGKENKVKTQSNKYFVPGIESTYKRTEYSKYVTPFSILSFEISRDITSMYFTFVISKNNIWENNKTHASKLQQRDLT